MLSTFATFVLAASTPTLLGAGSFEPQLSEQIVNPNSAAPKLEIGVLSAPLSGELSEAVRSWALSQCAHYGLPAAFALTFVEAFSTRFGASFHLQ